MLLAILGFLINLIKIVGLEIDITIRLRVRKKSRSSKSLRR